MAEMDEFAMFAMRIIVNVIAANMLDRAMTLIFVMTASPIIAIIADAIVKSPIEDTQEDKISVKDR